MRRAVVGVVLAGLAAVSFANGARMAPEDEAEGLTGPAKQTVKKGMWGPVEVEETGQPLFPAYRDLGVGLYSSSVRWDWNAPRPPKDPTDPNDPAYTWPAYLTQALAKAEKYKMETQVLVLGTPQWANGGKSWQWVPDKPGDFADFLTAISKRYPKVDDWMIWGEPNRAPNFQPFTPVTEGQETAPLNKAQQVAPQNYAELLDAAYGALKRADPKDKVIGGNTYTAAGIDDINPYQWIRYMKLPNGSRPRMDMWGHNPFGFAEPDLDDPPSRKGVVAFAGPPPPHGGARRELRRPTPEAVPRGVGVPEGFKDKDIGYVREPEEAEEWINAGFEIAREWPRIYSLGWIHPVDTDRSSMGLLNKGGKKKPTYDSYKGS